MNKRLVLFLTLAMVLGPQSSLAADAVAANEGGKPEVKAPPQDEPPFSRMFIGATGSSFEILLGSSEATRVKFNLTLGYLLTPHHQVNLSYGHEPAVVESKTFGGSDRYAAAYRFNLSSTPETAFYLQGTLGAYRFPEAIASDASSTYLVMAAEVGKNFRIFENSSFVFSPHVEYEKIENVKGRVKIVPIAFGFYFF